MKKLKQAQVFTHQMDQRPSVEIKGQEMKYTIKNLKADFPNDEACLDFIFKNRWPQGLTCPNCESKDFYHVKGRKSYACKCGYQVSPTKGTIFHKSSTLLTLWFHAIFLMSQSKNGVSAKELERQLGVTYKCAWRIARQIRILMSEDDGPSLIFSKVGQAFPRDS